MHFSRRPRVSPDPKSSEALYARLVAGQRTRTDVIVYGDTLCVSRWFYQSLKVDGEVFVSRDAVPSMDGMKLEIVDWLPMFSIKPTRRQQRRRDWIRRRGRPIDRISRCG